MADIINLRLHRKRKLREERQLQASENRTRHGRTPEQRKQEQAAEERERARLDGLRREPSIDEDPGD